MEPRKIYRSSEDRVIAGVCGGLGKYFNIDPVIFRIIFVVLFIGFCSGLLLYLVMWIVIPAEPFFQNRMDQEQINNRRNEQQ